MPDITNDIQKIREAVYGEEVRGSIINALEAMNESADAAEAWATGGTGGTAGAENNAKYYAEQAATAAETAASSAASGAAALANEAPAFDATKAYSAGEYVLYDSVLYRFTADHAAGAWTGTDATPAVIAARIEGLEATSSDMAETLYGKTDTEVENSNHTVPIKGSAITPAGTSASSPLYCRTSFIACGSIIRYVLLSDDYNYIVWTYGSTAVSSRNRCLTGDGYTDIAAQPFVIIRGDENVKYFRVGWMRKDGSEMTDDDVAAIAAASKYYQFGIEEYDEITDLFATGDSILPQEDILEGANATNVDVLTTRKSGGAIYTTHPVDMGTMAARTYTVRNIYGIYGYDSDGVYVDLKLTSGQYIDETITFDKPHRYVRVAVNRNARYDHDVVLGATIPASTHRGKLIAQKMDIENLVAKRAFLSPGDLGSKRYRMAFCTYTNDGVLLLGGEMRYSSGADNDNISIAFTRSFDNGKTFETPRILFERNVDEAVRYHTKSCGQFLVDRYTGKIFCFCLREDSNINRITTHTPKADYNTSILYKYSTDNGTTWSEEYSIDLRTDDMMMMVPSPGKGITTTDGTLVMPAWALYSDGSMYSLLVYSTNGGDTWTWSQTHVPLESTNESTVVEMPDNSTLLYMCRAEDLGYKAVYVTSDLGATYAEHPSSMYTLRTAICEANLTRVDYNNGWGQTVYLLTTPIRSDRGDVRLLCTSDFQNWKTVTVLTTQHVTRGYTCIAVWDDIVNIVEEAINDRLLCDAFRVPQSTLGSDALKIPAANNTTTMVRGEIVYNVDTGKLQFMDKGGNIMTIAFEN